MISRLSFDFQFIMKCNSTKNESKFPRVLLFILSMAPFFVILGLMTMDIPLSFGENAEFIGWWQLWQNTRVGVSIVIVSVIVECCIFILFKSACEREAPEESEIVEVVTDKNFELISLVTSIFLPLISFQYSQLSHWLVTFLIVIFVGYIFCNSNGFYTNPTLALFNYHLYDVTLVTQRSGSVKQSRHIIVLSRGILKHGYRVRCVKLDESVSYINQIYK